MLVLGIDPGQSGGLALVLPDNGGQIVATMPMPVMQVGKKKSLDINRFSMWIAARGHTDIAVGVIENVSAMPRQGVSSSFQFGRMFGAAEALMYEYCDRQDYVSPSVWKPALGLSKDKGDSLDLATRLFGNSARSEHWPLKKHEGVAEAALIALWWLRYRFVSAGD